MTKVMAMMMKMLTKKRRSKAGQHCMRISTNSHQANEVHRRMEESRAFMMQICFTPFEETSPAPQCSVHVIFVSSSSLPVLVMYHCSVKKKQCN